MHFFLKLNLRIVFTKSNHLHDPLISSGEPNPKCLGLKIIQQISVLKQQT